MSTKTSSTTGTSRRSDWRFWDGKPIRATPFLAFDTETEWLEGERGEDLLRKQIPQMACMQVSNGEDTVILHPSQVQTFVYLHSKATWVAFNTAFDYWVVHDVLGWVQPWREILADGRMHDAQILDFLIGLAEDRDKGATSHLRNLGKVAQQYGTTAEKDDPFRKEFGKLIGLSPSEFRRANPGYFDYAAQDAYATFLVWERASEKALELSPKERRRYGLLTEQLQVKAAVVLADVGRRGMAVDQPAVERVGAELKAKIEAAAAAMRADYPLALNAKGEVNPKTGVPKMRTDGVREYLLQEASVAGLDLSTVPTTAKTGKASTGQDWWKENLGHSRFVQLWSEMMDTAKLHQFVVQLKGRESLQSSYIALVRTGRTSARKPNIQQMPRASWFRSLFVARPGKKLIIADYSAIELRTLAAVLLDRFTDSKLADVLRAGLDPHVYTAAMVLGESYATVASQASAEKALVKAAQKEGAPRPPTPYLDARQSAKAINFGVPGGLGPARLRSYARISYGVELTEEEAAALRYKLIEEVYPEIGKYLHDSHLPIVAANLRCDPEELGRRMEAEGLRRGHMYGFENIVGGLDNAKKHKSWSTEKGRAVWTALQKANRNPELDEALAQHRASGPLYRKVFGATATTLTGRVRAGCDYGEAHNTPFQGLAADGAKNALWNLFHRASCPIVAFVHDEIVAEVNEEKANSWAGIIRDEMASSMSEVLEPHKIPVEVEVSISDTWTK